MDSLEVSCGVAVRLPAPKQLFFAHSFSHYYLTKNYPIFINTLQVRR